MFIYFVNIEVKPENIEQFKVATLENARNTVNEPGNLRFDVLQQADEPNRFALYEVYTDEAALEAHRQTEHYAVWKKTVENWMAQPRTATKFAELFFGDSVPR